MPGPAEAVSALWTDTARWPAWVDGFGRTASVAPGWPEPGAVLQWDSRPGGRGRVREQVLEHRPGAAHAVAVEDGQLAGTQSVRFDPHDGGAVRVRLALAYELKETNPFTPLVDLLYIRRALRASLQRSLARFARERAADSELGA